MPRLARDVVAAREKLAREMFAAGKSADDVQKALQTGWNGMKMAPGRLAELQGEASKPGEVVATPPPVIAQTDTYKVSTPAAEVDSGDPIGPGGSDGGVTETPVDTTPTKTYNPVADGFLEFCRAKAKAAGHVIVDVSEDIYQEWLDSLKVQE